MGPVHFIKKGSSGKHLNLQNYESESKSKIWGEVSMWKWMRKIICTDSYPYESENDKLFLGNLISLYFPCQRYKEKSSGGINRWLITPRNYPSKARTWGVTDDGVGHYIEKFWGKSYSVSLHNFYVMRSQPLHKNTSQRIILMQWFRGGGGFTIFWDAGFIRGFCRSSWSWGKSDQKNRAGRSPALNPPTEVPDIVLHRLLRSSNESKSRVIHNRATVVPSHPSVRDNVVGVARLQSETTPRVFNFKIQGPPNGGGFQTGGFPDLDLSFLFCPSLSFLGLSRFFRDFPDLLGDPIKSTYEEQSRKGPRHNLDLSRRKWETLPFSFSQKMKCSTKSDTQHHVMLRHIAIYASFCRSRISPWDYPISASASRNWRFPFAKNIFRARQRSGEGVVQRNGCPKGCFWRVRFFSAPLRFSGPFRCFKRKP